MSSRKISTLCISSPKLSRDLFFHRHKERKNHKTANLVEKSSKIGGVLRYFWFRQILILTLITFHVKTRHKTKKKWEKISFDSETFIQHYYIIIIFCHRTKKFWVDWILRIEKTWWIWWWKKEPQCGNCRNLLSLEDFSWNQCKG